jgi:hypothetical protein
MIKMLNFFFGDGGGGGGSSALCSITDLELQNYCYSSTGFTMVLRSLI